MAAGGPHRRQVSAGRGSGAAPRPPPRPSPGALPPFTPPGPHPRLCRAGSRSHRPGDTPGLSRQARRCPGHPPAAVSRAATLRAQEGSRRAAPRVGITWAGRGGSPLAPPPPARCNQLLLGRRAGNGLKGATQPPTPGYLPPRLGSQQPTEPAAAARAPRLPALPPRVPPAPVRRPPVPPRGGRGPFKEVVQSSRGAAKSSGSAEFPRPRPPRPPIGARRA